MTLLAIALLGIGGHDALRALLGRAGWFATAALWVGLVVLAILEGWGWLALLPAGAVAAWVLSWGPETGNRDAGERARPAGLALTALLIAVTFLAEGAFGTFGPVVGGSQATSALGLPLLIAAGVLVLTETSNRLVRAALQRERAPRQDPYALPEPALRGGRWIGPLERLAVSGLLVAGAYPVAAGVIAAKGIVRFPEIQRDEPGGNRAEYFLVGSLLSWTLALAVAGLIALAR